MKRCDRWQTIRGRGAENDEDGVGRLTGCLSPGARYRRYATVEHTGL